MVYYDEFEVGGYVKNRRLGWSGATTQPVEMRLGECNRKTQEAAVAAFSVRVTRQDAATNPERKFRVRTNGFVVFGTVGEFDILRNQRSKS